MTDPTTAASPKQTRRVLIIKHGAFGDMILATGPFRAIRTQFPDAHMTLITTAPFVSLATHMGIFDDIITDIRPKGLTGLIHRLKMGLQLRGLDFDWVFDLQHSSRTATYFHMMRWQHPSLKWSGIAAGCSHPHTNPSRDHMHTVERTAEQLNMAGVGSSLTDIPAFDLDWLKADISALSVPNSAVILVPAASPKRPEKVWPTAHYAALAKQLVASGYTPVVVGTSTDTPAAQLIQQQAPSTIDLTGKTTFAELASVGRHAVAAVGNDTGPMHLFAAVGTPSLVLFSHASVPSQTAPRGPSVLVHQVPDLTSLSAEDMAPLVFETLLSSQAKL